MSHLKEKKNKIKTLLYWQSHGEPQRIWKCSKCLPIYNKKKKKFPDQWLSHLGLCSLENAHIHLCASISDYAEKQQLQVYRGKQAQTVFLTHFYLSWWQTDIGFRLLCLYYQELFLFITSPAWLDLKLFLYELCLTYRVCWLMYLTRF